MTEASTATATSREAAAWSRYWASGALHSCPTTFTGNYGAEFRALWSEFFGALPAGARVLDLGTGNGAIALLARDIAAENKTPLEIEAIDSADIQPDRAAQAYGINYGGITFKSPVQAEATGYPDSWFDAIAGHYALEYTRTADTARELARITRPGAQLLFVMHHAGSQSLDTLRHELESFDYVDHQMPVIAHARRYLKRLTATNDPRELQRLANDSVAREQIRELEHMLGHVVARAKKRPDNAVLSAIGVQVTAIMRELKATGPAAGLQRLNHLADEMQGHRDRLAALLRASLDADGAERVRQELRQCGLSADPPAELKLHGRDLAGWTLRARRS